MLGYSIVTNMQNEFRIRREICMLFSNLIVIYGTGGSAKNFIVQNKELKNNIYAIVGKNVETGGCIEDINIKEDCVLKEISKPFDLVIASQYYDSIYNRLEREGKLSNPNLREIYTMNFYMDFPPYSDCVYIPDKEWNWLFEHFKDDYSLKLLKLIRENRGNHSSKRYLKIKDVLEYAGDEDYWKRVKGKNCHDKSVILDCGSYIGDKIQEIIQAVDRPVNAYYAFEPMIDSFNILSKAKVDGVENYYPVNKGVGLTNEFVETTFDEDKPDHSSVAFGKTMEGKTIKIYVTNIDSLGLKEGYDYYIKMDIEGSELDALKGGEKTIRAIRPNLAVCLYHKTEDLYKIPQWIESLNIGYKLYLSGGNHTILLAIPE